MRSHDHTQQLAVDLNPTKRDKGQAHSMQCLSFSLGPVQDEEDSGTFVRPPELYK
jgi:hypothetical protein